MKISKRKIIQFAIALLYNSNFQGFKNAELYRGIIKNVCVPGLNCYSCPGAIAACPIGAFQKQLMGAKGIMGILTRFPYYVIGLMILFGIIFGRIVCGFLCPFGLVQELLYKIKSVKIKKSNVTRKLTYIKYFVLVVFVVMIPMTLYYPGFCKFICPVGTLEAGVINVVLNERLRSVIGFLFGWKVIVAITILIMSIFMFRFFCRFLCPLGAIYGFFNKVSIMGIKIDSKKCTHCNACINHCFMDVKRVGDRECIECGECRSVCKEGAIFTDIKI